MSTKSPDPPSSPTALMEQISSKVERHVECDVEISIEGLAVCG